MVENTVKERKNKEEPITVHRLVDAVLGIWETHGSAGISARLIAQSAGLPVSGIYYHFGDLERLLLSAQEHARTEAEKWCAAQLAALPDKLAPASEALPPVMAALIADWSESQRQLAFAWRECQLMSVREPNYLPAFQAWLTLWSSFWEEVCSRFGVPEQAELTCHFFHGESFLHLARWRSLVDRACLDEICWGWGRWLSGRLSHEGPWRQLARHEAGSTMADLPLLEGTGARIAAAAADIVTRLGPASLTHRAVAMEAGVTVGVVSYNFRTSADLVKVAFETLYRRVMAGHVESASALPPGKHPEFLEAILLAEDSEKAKIDRLAMNELLIAVARDETLHAFSIQLRYLRGRTSRHYFAALLGSDSLASPLDAAILSNLLMGIDHSCIGLGAAARLDVLHRGLQEIEKLLAIAAD